MSEEIENSTVINRPLDALPERLQEPFKFPATRTECSDVTDGAHGNLNQSVFIGKWLGQFVSIEDTLQNFVIGFLERLCYWVWGIETADPGVSKFFEHTADGGVLAESIAEAAWRTEAGGLNFDSRLKCFGCDADVFANSVGNWHASQQPWGALEAKLEVIGASCEDVDVVVGVIADWMTVVGEFGQPCDIGLFKNAADGEEMNHAASSLDALGCCGGVAFGFFVEISFFVIPVCGFPGREVSGHFKVEGDGDLSRALWAGVVELGEGNQGGSSSGLEQVTTRGWGHGNGMGGAV